MKNTQGNGNNTTIFIKLIQNRVPIQQQQQQLKKKKNKQTFNKNILQ